jgi:hypothetical protein
MSKETTIRINSDNHGGNTRVGVNGVFTEIPHNTDFPVTEGELDALRNSSTKFTVVSGGEAEQEQPEQGLLADSPAEPPQRALEDGSEAKPVEVREQDEQRAGEPEDDGAAAAQAEIGQDDDPDEEGSASLNAKPFSAATTLEQSIAKITEDMDEFTPRQLKALLDAENKAETPRSTLIAALEKKIGAE